MSNPGSSWTARAMTAAGTVLVVAVVGRLVWELLVPLAGPLLVLAGLCAVLQWIRRRRW